MIYCNILWLTLWYRVIDYSFKNTHNCKGSLKKGGQTKFKDRCHMASVNNCLQLLLHKWLLRKQSIILPTVAVFSELFLWQPECQFSFCKSTWCPRGGPFPLWCNTLTHAMHTEVVFCHVQVCFSCLFFYQFTVSIFFIIKDTQHLTYS